MPAFLTLRAKKAEFQDLLAETGPAVSLPEPPGPRPHPAQFAHYKKGPVPGRSGRDRPRRFPRPETPGPTPGFRTLRTP